MNVPCLLQQLNLSNKVLQFHSRHFCASPVVKMGVASTKFWSLIFYRGWNYLVLVLTGFIYAQI